MIEEFDFTLNEKDKPPEKSNKKIKPYAVFLIGLIIGAMLTSFIFFKKEELSNEQIANNFEYILYNSEYPSASFLEKMDIKDLKYFYSFYNENRAMMPARAVLLSFVPTLCKGNIAPLNWSAPVLIGNLTISREKAMKCMMEGMGAS